MRTTPLARMVGALCLGASFALAAAVPAGAATPRWTMTAIPSPATVANTSAVAYAVTISNLGPSNISALYLQTSASDVPVYLAGANAGSCASGTTARLSCSFGALGAGKSVTLTVGYATPSSGNSYNPGFLASTTGASLNDKGKNSHGDNLTPSNNPAVALRSDKNFAGGFALTTNTISTDPTLGNSNIQATSVTPPVNDVPATAEDGLSDTGAFGHVFSCPTGYCGVKHPFGEWSKVNVADGTTFGGYFPVTLMIYGKSVPSTVTTSSIALIHTDDQGNVIGSGPLTQCAPGAPLANCIQVTKVGSNYKIVAWVNHNGGFKGMG